MMMMMMMMTINIIITIISISSGRAGFRFRQHDQRDSNTEEDYCVIFHKQCKVFGEQRIIIVIGT